VSRTALIDTGPLVALIDRGDRFHAWTTATLEHLQAPLLSCQPVVTEACFLLRHLRGGQQAVLSLVERGVVRLDFDLEKEVASLSQLLTRYANVPMALADACLVRMSERHASTVVMTLDGDFRLYRRHGRQAIPLVVPDGR
jgi:predicted nucleic acid-binding protein